MKLWKHQEEAVKLFKKYNYRIYLNWDTGTGKTIGALAILKEYSLKKSLIVAPKSSQLSWANDNQYFNLDLTVITYESFRSKINNIENFDAVVFDEAHRLKNPKAQVSKKAFELVGKSDIPRLMLSGTPADRYYELFMQYKILDPDLIPYRSYSSFINTYYYLNKYWQPESLKKPEYAEELKSLFNILTHRVRKEDVLELPPLLHQKIILPKFKLTSEITEDNINLYTVSNFIKEYKYSQGINEAGSLIRTDKVDWLIDFVEDNPQTIAFSLFKAIPEYIKKKMKDKFYIITGEDKRDLEKAIMKSDKPIISTYALKEGANLQKYKNIVYLSLPLAYRDLEQSLSRIYRAGQTSKSTAYYLLQNKIDYMVYNILNEKKDVYNFLRKED